jgi:uncharacterized sulfatase
MPNLPNVLIIHTDQQSLWTIGRYGGDLIDTPNIDRIGREGATFRNFFAVSAVCTPSRGSFITGRYPHAHGAYVNNIPLNRDEVTLAHVLSANEYETGYIGKWHLDANNGPGWISPFRSMGFHDCRHMFNRGHWKIVKEHENDIPELTVKEIGDETTYTTDWLADRAVEFVSRRRARPFFLMISFPDPHTPFTVREPYASMYDPDDMPVPSTFHEEHRPDWIEEQTKTNLRYEGWDEERLKREKAQYCGEVRCIDDNVGKLLGSLEEQGVLDDTVVVFTTDHGEYMGEHGLRAKDKIYETAYHIPLLVRWPRRVPAGTEVERFVSQVDFQQTILSLIGLEPSGREQGRDASPFLLGHDTEWTDEVFIHSREFRWAGIFTPEYELGLVKDRQSVLFDRRADPEQVNNLFTRPELRGVVTELTRRVVEHYRAVDCPSLPWVEELHHELGPTRQ